MLPTWKYYNIDFTTLVRDQLFLGGAFNNKHIDVML